MSLGRACAVATAVYLLVAASGRADLVVHYNFDVDQGAGEMVVNQASPGTYDGLLGGNAHTSGGVAIFDGSGDWVDTYFPTDNLTSPVTFSFWMEAANVAKSAVISGYVGGNTNRWDIQLDRLGNGKIGFQEHQSGGGYTPSTTTIAPSTWYHVAVTHDKPNTGNVSVYVNGQLENTRALGHDLQTGINLKLGMGDGQYDGSLDDVAVWNNQVLGACQIKGIYDKKAVVTQDGDWATAATWFGQPGAGEDAIVAGGTTVAVNSGTATADSLTLGCTTEAGTLDYNAGTLDVDTINVGPNGIIDSNKSNWVFTGDLNIDGGTVDQNSGFLQFNAGAQVTLAGATGRIEGSYAYLGYNSGTSTLHQTDGTFILSSDLALGRASGGTGEYTLDGGLLEVRTVNYSSPGLRLGRQGTGTFTQNGGDVLVHYGGVSLGEDGGNGTYHFNGGTLTTPRILVGTHASGSSVFNLTGGTLNADSITVGPSGTLNSSLSTWTYKKQLVVDGGTVDAGTRTLIFDDGAQVTVGGSAASITAGHIRVGNSSATQAVFTQTDGLVDVPSGGYTHVGMGASADGKLSLSGDAHFRTNALMVGSSGTGLVEVGGNAHLEVTTSGTAFQVGVSGDGTIVQTGGTVSQPGTGAMYLGYNAGAVGHYIISGGTLEQGSLTVGGNSGGTGYVTQSGGEVIAHRDVRVGRGGGYGEYNISDGTLDVDGTNLYVGFDGTATALFNQTGGTVQTVGDVSLARLAANSGTYEILAGELHVDGTLRVGYSGTGRFHVIGDAATIETDGYSQNALSTLELDINGISPINVDGTITLAGWLDVEFSAVPSVGDQFTVFVNDGSDDVSGIFSGMPEGFTFTPTNSDIALLITYQANVDGGLIGNDVVLSAVPEPATLCLLALGGLLLAALFGRHRRHTSG